MCVHACACFAFHSNAGHLIINTHAPLAVSRLSHTFKSPHGASGHSEKWNISIWTDVLLSTMHDFMQSLNKWNALWTAQATFQIQTVGAPSKKYLGWRRDALLPAQTLDRSPLLWILKINCSQMAYCPINLQKYRISIYINTAPIEHRGQESIPVEFATNLVKATPNFQTSPWESPLIIWFQKRCNN